MKNLKITKGSWVIDDNYEGFILTNNGAYKPNAMLQSCATKEERKANAQLIADAGTTANKCGKLPSELLAERDELLEALQALVDANIGNGKSVMREIEKAQKTINKTLSK